MKGVPALRQMQPVLTVPNEITEQINEGQWVHSRKQLPSLEHPRPPQPRRKLGFARQIGNEAGGLVGGVAVQVRRALRVGDDVDHLGQVDHDQPAAMHQQVFEFGQARRE